MKKHILYILFLVLLLCSCNIDSEHGIYYRVATSVKNSGIKLSNYIGYYNNKHYLISDNGIRIAGEKEPIAKTVNKYFKQASLLPDGTIWLLNSKGIAYKYSIESDTLEKDSDTSFNGLKDNVLYKTGDNSFFINISLANPTIKYVHISSALISESFLLSMDGTTAHIYDTADPDSQDPCLTITGFSSSYATGFQYLPAHNCFIVFDSTNAYFVSAAQIQAGGEISLSDTRQIASSMESVSSSKIYETTDEYSEGKILIRTYSGFYIIEMIFEDDGVTLKEHHKPEKQSWMNSLNNVNVVRMFSYAQDKIAVTTYENGVHIADMSTENSAEFEKDIL